MRLSDLFAGEHDAEPGHSVRARVQLRHAEEDRDVGPGLSVQLGQFQHSCTETVDKRTSSQY